MFTAIISRSTFFIDWYDFGLVDKEYVFRCGFDGQNQWRGEERKEKTPYPRSDCRED
jgi:hypothetical protein